MKVGTDIGSCFPSQEREDMMRLETEQTILAAKINGEKYDESISKLFSNKEIIAPILQLTVPEFKGLSIENIIKSMDTGKFHEIPVSDIPIQMEGLPTEMKSIADKVVRYDIRFKCTLPENPISADVHLFIDLEVQNDYTPGYPITKRAMYYVARMLSEQLGPITEKTNYNVLCKSYSIWICNTNVPMKDQNSVTEFHMDYSNIVGKHKEPVGNYDLMSVIIIRRGTNNSENTSEGILDYLNGVFSSNLNKMQKYSNVKWNEELIKEVHNMTGFGATIAKENYDKGVINTLSLFLRSGTTEKELLDKGFSKDYIEKAKELNKK